MLNGVGEEVGIHKDGVWRYKSGVVLEEQRRRNLGATTPVSREKQLQARKAIHFLYHFISFSFPLALELAFQLILLSAQKI